VDLLPSLAELAGLPQVNACPAGPNASRAVALCSDGQSFVAAFSDPSGAVLKSREGVLSQVRVS
jgi:hypothetical protein